MTKDLTKESLELIYRSKTNKEVCAELKISPPTLSKYLKKLGIKQKPIGNFSNKDKKKFNLV